MAEEISIWVGESGAKYPYYVYDRDLRVPKRMGIFIYSKKNDEDLWVPLFVGQGDLSLQASADRDLVARIEAKGATHIHLRVNSEALDRHTEVADILKRYQNAFEPEGCNVKEKT
jgi:hypothetical protein